MDGTVYARGYPPGQASARLMSAISAVCLADGVSVGRWDDRSTWRLDHAPEASEAEIAAARAVMAAFDPWDDGAPGDPVPVWREDEDPGEQDDLGAEMLAAEDEAGEDNAELEASEPGTLHDSSTNAPSEDVDHANDGAAYPGIAILPDELGARRNAVLAAIATEKLTRLKIAMDPSQAAFLSERFAEYQNRGALGLDIDEALNADRQAYLDMRDRQQAIYYFAMQLEQSALDGDMDRLSAMHAGLSDGWP